MRFLNLALVLATAFTTPQTPTIRVTFVLMEAFPNQPTLTAVVRRDHRHGDQEYVAVKRKALTPELLFAATKGWTRSVQRYGRTPAQRVTMYFSEHGRVPPLTEEQRAYAQRIIDTLSHASSRTLPGIDGQHPAVTLDVATAIP